MRLGGADDPTLRLPGDVHEDRKHEETGRGLLFHSILRRRQHHRSVRQVKSERTSRSRTTDYGEVDHRQHLLPEVDFVVIPAAVTTTQ